MPECNVPDPWTTRTDDVQGKVRAWRAAHPHATWVEIEAAVDAEIGRMRGELLEEAVAASPLRDFRGAARRPGCPHCATPLQAMGQQERVLTTTQEQTVVVERTYGRCPRCGAGFFPPG